MEIWKDIPGYEGRYLVSNKGRVKRLFWFGNICPEEKQFIKPSKVTWGHLNVTLNNGHTKKMFGVHRLVALAFIPNPNNLPEVNHIDHDPANNNLENLEWITHRENVKHAWGFKSTRKKTSLLVKAAIDELVNPKPNPKLNRVKHELIREKALRFLGISDDQLLEETKNKVA